MADQPGTDSHLPESHDISMGLPLGIGAALIEMTAGLMADPAGLAGARMSRWRDHMDLWGNTAWRMIGGDPEPAAVADQDDTESWLAGASRHAGSWWPDRDRWLERRSGKSKVSARVPGDGALEVIEDAPGIYLRTRADRGTVN